MADFSRQDPVGRAGSPASAAHGPARTLLTVSDLTITYGRSARPAVRNASFEIQAGDRVGLVGESGSGKSTLASAIQHTLPASARAAGSVRLGDDDLLTLDAKRLRRLRSTTIARVPQDPLSSLNPVFPIGTQLSDVVRAHRKVSRAEVRSIVEEALVHVGISDAAVKRRSFPHELSGGMRQRVMIAMALINHPSLLIADEPTTALDVTVQAQIVELLRQRVAESDMTLLLISHDIGVISELCTRVMVMYDGEIVEQGTARDVLTAPQHAYTKSLLAAARGNEHHRRAAIEEATA